MKNENILLQVQILRGQLATIQDGLRDLQADIVGEQPLDVNEPSQDEVTIYNRGQAAIVATLQGKTYPVTINTIARETGLTHATISNYLGELRERGLKIETTRRGYSRPRYRLYGGA